MEKQRLEEIVRRHDADLRDLIAEVKRRPAAGEDREKVRAWADQQQREIWAEVQPEIDEK